MSKILSLLAVLLMAWTSVLRLSARSSSPMNQTFNGDWKFYLVSDTLLNSQDYSLPSQSESGWQSVSLPHTAHLEPLLVNNQWQGICWYRKHFNIADYSAQRKYFIGFEGAMNRIEIWINGKKVKSDQGGYLPVVVDASPYLKAKNNLIAVRLDNRDNPETGPKPLKILDFNMYGGLYRDAWIQSKNQTYITNPSYVDEVAGGGVFITYPQVSAARAVVQVKTNVQHEAATPVTFRVLHQVYRQGQMVQSVESEPITLASQSRIDQLSTFQMDAPALWSPTAPNLYTLRTSLVSGSDTLDCSTTRFGIREFAFKHNKLYINGEPCYLRGVNRHQEYPFIGYALSDNAQYRDAYKIKQAGFDFIRLSHYPQSPAFMDACDELGLVVLDAILGWQYYNPSDAFNNQCFRAARQLVRRDRNHPCVLAWEVSLNETKMPIPFMQTLQTVVHEEYPSQQTYTCGWMPEVYDIYLQARQHRLKHDGSMLYDKPYGVSEYGDWEYYSTNAGLNQHKMSKAERVEKSSRQARSDGEARLLCQARNVQEAHNDNLRTTAFGDGYWIMFDYNRGYHNDLELSGLMDIFRLPKFAVDFYRSQRDAQESGYMASIATYWNERSPLDVMVYSNADEVELFLNGRSVARQKPDADSASTRIKHPPFTFHMPAFQAGTLRAVAYGNGREVALAEVRTPQAPVALKGWVDLSGKDAQAGCNDVLFVYFAVTDQHGTVCPDVKGSLTLDVPKELTLMNVDGVQIDAGIATALVRVDGKPGTSYELRAHSQLDNNVSLSGKISIVVP